MGNDMMNLEQLATYLQRDVREVTGIEEFDRVLGGGIVPGSAPQVTGLGTKLAAGCFDGVHLRRIHRRGRHPGQQFALRRASFLVANGLQSLPEGLDDATNDGLLQVPDLERKPSLPGNDVDATRFEGHHPDVGDGVAVDLLDHLFQPGRAASRSPSGVMA